MSLFRRKIMMAAKADNDIRTPLYFSALADVTISVENNGGNTPSLQYSFDKQSWTDWDYSAISVSNGSTLYIRGNNSSGVGTSSTSYSTIVVSGGNVNCGGNVMSLLAYDFASLTEVPAFGFYRLFRGNTTMLTAPLLPATTLNRYCYFNMFGSCSSMTIPPTLPASTLAMECYGYMFQSCTALQRCPTLAATDLVSRCYNYMFQSCRNISCAIDLPATTLESYCYQGMFNACTSITEVKNLPAETLVDNCYKNMFNGCTNLARVKAMFLTEPSDSYTAGWLTNVASEGVFVKNAEATWSVVGTNGVPTGWTIETT